MEVLDFIVRGIFIPCIWIFIFNSVPGLKEDVKEWVSLFADGKKKKVRRKRKTVQVPTVAPVSYSNSFSHYSKVSDRVILSHK